MAYTKPCTITELCEQFNLHLYELCICCVFCRKRLEDYELWVFKNRDLYVVWQKNFPFALCCKCIEVRVIVDLLRHFEKAAFAQTVEEETGQPLGDLCIRCYGCLKPLSATEKLFHVEDGRPFNRIAGNWRGRCTNCLYLPSRLVYYFFYVATGRPNPPIPGLLWGFDERHRQAAESDTSSWTTTSSSASPAGSRHSSVSSGRRDNNSDASDTEGDIEVLI
ncbi:E6 [Tursiops truncatus papillomavirus 3]|uniref:Protein E6 n=1 Tax=Tursiops truncatus papillomavirus type 3 TaxID=496865 RepID=B4XYE7_9PAPI|nr:E6 [Tursiops truncatus papillomavirus type 3]